MDTLAARQGLPPKFLETIFTELRKDGVVISRRGVDGGYRLARPAREISVADVIRAVDGPLAAVRGLRPEDTEYDGAATALPHVWIALRDGRARGAGERLARRPGDRSPAAHGSSGSRRSPSAWQRR